MGRIVNKRDAKKALAVLHETGNKTEALKAIGHADANAACTRYFRQPSVQSLRAEVEAEHLAALGQVGLNASAWATGLKAAVDVGNPAGLRLYAEVVKLIGEEQAAKVLVMVQTQAAEAIVPMIVKYIPLDRMAEFRAELRQHYGQSDASGGDSGHVRVVTGSVVGGQSGAKTV